MNDAKKKDRRYIARSASDRTDNWPFGQGILRPASQRRHPYKASRRYSTCRYSRKWRCIVSDPKDTYSPRLTGRDALPPLSDAGHSGPWAHPPRRRDASRRDAWGIVIGVLMLCAMIGAFLFSSDPLGKITADAVRAESITFPKGY